MNPALDRLLTLDLDALQAGARRRRLRPLQVVDGRLQDAQGRVLIDASSNDYLGLAQHPAVKARAAEWAARHGAGAPSSRLVTGTREITLAVEQKLAAFKGCEAALLFSSGFQANATVIPALARVGAGNSANATPNAAAAIFSDELNHASMVHGCRAARATTQVFRHNDLGQLDELLRRCPAAHKLILTESVFSMDGDRADLPALVQLAERHGATLYVDEAHATGVLGPQGRGLAAECGQSGGGVDIVMGTLGKALGAFGAYIAVDAALDLVPGMDAERERLARNSQRLREVLAQRNYDTLGSTTQIVPAVIGAEQDTLDAAQGLENAGVLAVAIRPPTVPAGSSRLRLTLSSALGGADMQRLLDAVALCLPERSAVR